MKKLHAILALGAISLLALTGCTQAKPTQNFNTAKPNAACLIKAPGVKNTNVQAGTTLKFSATGAGCAVKYTAKGQLTVNLTSVKGKNLVASATVKGDKQGAYSGELYIPQVATPGTYRLAVTYGVESKCADTGSCAAPITQITVQKLNPTPKTTTAA